MVRARGMGLACARGSIRGAVVSDKVAKAALVRLSRVTYTLKRIISGMWQIRRAGDQKLSIDFFFGVHYVLVTNFFERLIKDRFECARTSNVFTAPMGFWEHEIIPKYYKN